MTMNLEFLRKKTMTDKLLKTSTVIYNVDNQNTGNTDIRTQLETCKLKKSLATSEGTILKLSKLNKNTSRVLS